MNSQKDKNRELHKNRKFSNKYKEKSVNGSKKKVIGNEMKNCLKA